MATQGLEIDITVKADQAAREIGGLSTQLTKLNKSVGGTTTTLTNFGRVVQDAPFGIIGIANNIDPLISSFQKLKSETGSTGAALKALAGGLVGPAGIAIGISAITSLLIAFGPQIKAAFTDVDKEALAAAKATEELTKAIDGFSNSSFDAAGKEKALVDSLIAGTQNLNLTQKERLFYVDELQKKYPAYFSNLKDEDILAGKTGDAYQRLTTAILAAAKARAAQDVLSKIAAEQLALDEKRAKVNEEFQNRIAKAQTGSRVITGGGIAPTTTTVTVTAEEKKAQALAGQTAALAEINKRYSELNKQAEFYGKFVEQGAGAVANLDQNVKKVTKSTKEGTDSIADQRKALDELYATSNANVGKQGTLVIGREEGARLQFLLRTVLADTEKIGPATATASASLTELLQKQSETLGQLKAATEAQLAEDSLEQKTQNAVAAFNLLTPAIDQAFNALANGENAFEAVQQALKRLLIDLAKAAALSLILAAITGGTSAGAQGGGFLNIFKGFLGFKASGGPMPGAAMVGESGPEMFIPGANGAMVNSNTLRGMGNGNVAFEIRGDVLFGLLKKNGLNRAGTF